MSRAIFRKIDELDEAGRIHVLPLEDVGLATWVKQIDTEARWSDEGSEYLNHDAFSYQKHTVDNQIYFHHVCI